MSVTVAQARRLVELKDEMNDKGTIADKAAKAYRTAEEQFWLDLDEDEAKTSTITLDLGKPFGKVQFQKRETITGRVLSDDEAVEALKALGLEDEILGGRQIRKGVLNEHVRQWLRSGMPLPEGVDFNAKRYVTVSKKG